MTKKEKIDKEIYTIPCAGKGRTTLLKKIELNFPTQ